MPLNQLPALLLAILAAAYTPGPANLYAMSCSIQHGIRHSMTMWFGLLCGFITGALITAAIAHAAGIAFAAYFLAGPGANLVWLLAGHALKPLLASHLKAVSTVMALALVACSVYLFVAH